MADNEKMNGQKKLNGEKKQKIVFLTGAGMSVESGFKTFRGNDGLWENYPVQQVDKFLQHAPQEALCGPTQRGP